MVGGQVAILGGEAAWRLYRPALAALDLEARDVLAAGPVAAVIVTVRDLQAARQALASGRRVLLGVEALAALQREVESNGSWLPSLPLPLALEVGPAAEVLTRGRFGPPRLAHLVTYVGPAPTPSWDLDAPFAATAFEAAVWGLDLAEQLVHCQVAETRWTLPLRDGGPGLAVHKLTHGVVVSHQFVLSAAGPGPAFQATVVCDRGQLLLRAPFAPGAVAIWTDDPAGFVIPAVPFEKPNIQASDSTPGGWETRTLLQALLSNVVPPRLARRKDALRLVRHVETSLQAAMGKPLVLRSSP